MVFGVEGVKQLSSGGNLYSLMRICCQNIVGEIKIFLGYEQSFFHPQHTHHYVVKSKDFGVHGDLDLNPASPMS